MKKDPLQGIGPIPFDLSILQSLYPNCKDTPDLAQRLEADGRIVRLKRGLYVANDGMSNISLELIANHIYGPSYVSMSRALRWYGLIPERVFLMQSVTTKHSRKFSNSLGNFHYQNCSADYFPIGITMQGQDDIRFLIASPEKALCDYICFNKVRLRFKKDVGIFLEEDLRFDTDVLRDLNLDIIRQCAETGRKTESLLSLLKYLQHDNNI